MIKSDRWIKAQCMPPLASVSFLMHNPLDEREILRGRLSETIVGDPFTDIDVEVRKILDKARYLVPNSALITLSSDDVVENFKPMIEPFLPMQVRETTTNVLTGEVTEPIDDLFLEKRKIISKGLTSFGYDVTLAEDAAIFSNINGTIIDPLNFVEEALIRVTAKNGYFIMPPNSYMLGYTKEYFRMPRNVIAIALGKSTYARAGAIVNVTPIEPGFEGTVVIEIANATSLPMKVYTDQGIAQFLFFESDEDCETSYADRNGGEGGKYQGQRGLQLPKG